MTGLIILTFVPFVVAIGFLIRVRAEQKARRAAEQQLATLQARVDQHEQYLRDVHPVFAHELRSPISAILGYEELLGEGTLGTVDPRARDALRRIRTAALQLCDLADGIDRLGRDSVADEAGAPVDSNDIISHAVDALALEAQSRDVSLFADGPNLTLQTRPDEARRAVVLALGAAIKVSPGATLRLMALDGPTPAIHITGTRLDADADSPRAADPLSARQLTGAGLRLAFAAAAAQTAGGSITLEARPPGADVRIDLPTIAD
jgi:signal transduction histidine kinase